MTANWPIPVMEAGSRRTASLRGLQIHNQLKLDRHLHRKIRWLCPVKNLVDVSCGLAIRIGGHAPVGDEATALGKITLRRSYTVAIGTGTVHIRILISKRNAACKFSSVT